MMKKNKKELDDILHPEYDLSKLKNGIKGKSGGLFSYMIKYF
jgi:hypothetical protein